MQLIRGIISQSKIRRAMSTFNIQAPVRVAGGLPWDYHKSHGGSQDYHLFPNMHCHIPDRSECKNNFQPNGNGGLA
jgi:hypothetical protein